MVVEEEEEKVEEGKSFEDVRQGEFRGGGGH